MMNFREKRRMRAVNANKKPRDFKQTWEKGCPDCGETDYEVRNHDFLWGDGEIYCKGCGRFLRYFDAG